MLTGLFLLAFLQSPDSIVAAAHSPYQLAKFVQTHAKFDWEPLWKELRIEAFMPRCERSFEGVPPCSAELLTTSDRTQVILLLENDSDNFQVYMRYRVAGSGGWQFDGSFSPYVKYFRPEHRMGRIGDRDYLVVTGQGMHGTGLSTKLEHWIDLAKFRPDLVFAMEAHYSPYPEGVGRVIWGAVTAATADRVTVSRSVEFRFAVDEESTEESLGERRDETVYRRDRDGRFVLDERLSTLTKHDVDLLYGGLEGFSKSDFLRLYRESLRKIAGGPDTKARRWLSAYIAEAPDARELRDLLKRRD